MCVEAWVDNARSKNSGDVEKAEKLVDELIELIKKNSEETSHDE
jgi:hypothetical protein